MKTYPSIVGCGRGFRDYEGQPCVAFVKYDGSNIRAEWSRKRGWYKFGTKKTMFDANDPNWGHVIPLFHQKLGDEIERVIGGNKDYKGVDSVIAFAEYFGPNSFAGQHVEEDPKELMLFDINVHKKGFLSPQRFVGDFGSLVNRAQVAYEGELTKDLVEDVKIGKYPVQEGLVCKGGEGHKLWMMKIKTKEWIDAVKAKFPRNWTEFHDPQDEA